MTVKELIERLEECDPEADVTMDTGSLNLVFIKKVVENYEYNVVVIS